jgi:hypothetical protein
MSIKERKRGCIDMKFVDVTDEVLANKEEYNYYNVIDLWVLYEKREKGEWVAYAVAPSHASALQKKSWFENISPNNWKIERRYMKYVKEN